MEDLNEDVVTEILVRLPSASVGRCRAVCKAWRGITSCPDFVAAYGRRRRPLQLIVEPCPRVSGGVLDTIPLAALLDDDDGKASSRRLYPGCPDRIRAHYWLMGYCDGLLLFERFCGPDTDHWICNPVTRQWAAVPLRSTRLTTTTTTLTLLCAFYLHRPSGEHRLLFVANDAAGLGMLPHDAASHYIRSLEAAETRWVGPARSPLDIFTMGRSISDHLEYHGKLHWLRHPEVDQDQETADDIVVAFDTVSETFRQMSRPHPMLSLSSSHHRRRRYRNHLLLEMDGMLAMAAVLDDDMHLWVLQDYSDDKSWTCRHRIHQLPPTMLHACWAILVPPPAVGRRRQNNNDDDDTRTSSVLILGDCTSHSVGIYDLTQRRLLKQIHPSSVEANASMFKDSLQQHAFFDRHRASIYPASTPQPILQSAAAT
ncbi:hypothetical protein BS78_09G256300 [Paspalum vaginatum]|nr:hypothetical protein BS78_09G256300 [Paspalum vaginatum]